jgi:hypothetical protein
MSLGGILAGIFVMTETRCYCYCDDSYLWGSDSSVPDSAVSGGVVMLLISVFFLIFSIISCVVSFGKKEQPAISTTGNFNQPYTTYPPFQPQYGAPGQNPYTQQYHNPLQPQNNPYQSPYQNPPQNTPYQNPPQNNPYQSGQNYPSGPNAPKNPYVNPTPPPTQNPFQNPPQNNPFQNPTPPAPPQPPKNPYSPPTPPTPPEPPKP